MSGQRRDVTHEDRPVFLILRQASVAAFHQCGIQRDDIHEVAEAELLLRQREAELELG